MLGQLKDDMMKRTSNEDHDTALLLGLLTCGVCGGSYVVGDDGLHYVCACSRNSVDLNRCTNGAHEPVASTNRLVSDRLRSLLVERMDAIVKRLHEDQRTNGNMSQPSRCLKDRDDSL